MSVYQIYIEVCLLRQRADARTETTATNHITQTKNIQYQPLLIKPVFSLLAHAEKSFFSKLVFQWYIEVAFPPTVILL